MNKTELFELELNFKLLNLKTNYILLLLIAMFLIWTGWALNQSVMMQNGGRMPVKGYEINNSLYIGFFNDDEVFRPMLADRIHLPFGLICSLGDIFIYSSMALTLWTMYYTLSRSHKLKKRLQSYQIKGGLQENSNS